MVQGMMLESPEARPSAKEALGDWHYIITRISPLSRLHRLYPRDEPLMRSVSLEIGSLVSGLFRRAFTAHTITSIHRPTEAISHDTQGVEQLAERSLKCVVEISALHSAHAVRLPRSSSAISKDHSLLCRRDNYPPASILIALDTVPHENTCYWWINRRAEYFRNSRTVRTSGHEFEDLMRLRSSVHYGHAC